MKRLLLTLAVFAASLSAQSAWNTFSSQTGSTNLSTAMDAKPNYQISTQVGCTDKNGTQGKDLCTDSAGNLFQVSVTGAPATWVRTSAHPPLVSGDIPNNAANTSGTAANATQVNGASVPASLSCAGTNGSSQIVSATCGTPTNKATFSSFGGTMSGLSVSGCITGVNRTNVGQYTALLSGCPSNIAVAFACGDTGVSFAMCVSEQVLPVGASSFAFSCDTITSSPTAIDCKFVSLVLQ